MTFVGGLPAVRIVVVEKPSPDVQAARSKVEKAVRVLDAAKKLDAAQKRDTKRKVKALYRAGTWLAVGNQAKYMALPSGNDVSLGRALCLSSALLSQS